MTIEAELRLHRCAFTGHRPEKLGLPEAEICQKLEKEIYQAISDHFTVFITGMARGVDIWAGEIVLRLRSEGAPVRLICASPYRGFENGWSSDWKRRYNFLIRDANLVRFICPGYSRTCFQTRNQWMVNHSSRVIAAYNGTPGGTQNTLRYCIQSGVQIRNIFF